MFTPRMLCNFCQKERETKGHMPEDNLTSLLYGAAYLYVNFADWNLFMISYIINLFMIHYDLKKNNGYSETKKRRYFVCVCVCVCFPISSKKLSIQWNDRSYIFLVRHIEESSRSVLVCFVYIVRVKVMKPEFFIGTANYLRWILRLIFV